MGRVSLEAVSTYVPGVLIDAIERVETTPELHLHDLKHSLFQWRGPRNSLTRLRVLWRWAVAATGLSNQLTVIPSETYQVSGVQLAGSHRLVIDTLTSESFAALFSSLMHSRGVHELVISSSIHFSKTDAFESRLKWLWLFYGLFHDGASHSVTSLSIELEDMQLDDFVALQELVRSPRPLEMLMHPTYEQAVDASPSISRLQASPSRPTRVTLRTGSCVQIDPRRVSELQIWTAREQTFDVMHELSDGFDILVPGYGQCWVTHEDIVKRIPTSEGNPREQWRENNGFTELFCVMYSTVPMRGCCGTRSGMVGLDFCVVKCRGLFSSQTQSWPEIQNHLLHEQSSIYGTTQS